VTSDVPVAKWKSFQTYASAAARHTIETPARAAIIGGQGRTESIPQGKKPRHPGGRPLRMAGTPGFVKEDTAIVIEP